MKPPSERYTVAVDFDGVIHAYDSPWVAAHIIPDDPVPGAIAWLIQTIQKFDIVIHSTRCRTWRGRRAVRRWIKKHSGAAWYESCGAIGIESVRLSWCKPPALIYIDDRAFRFEGEFPSAETIHKARPWNKPRTKK